MFRTLIREPGFKIGVAIILSAFAIAAWAGIASATDVNVTQSAKCTTGRNYDVTVAAHNTYSQTLHITVNNPASPIGVTLAPGQTWSYTFHVSDSPWTVTVTTSDAILHGDTHHTWTPEAVCGVPATTTTSPPPTTCERANPPRTDCGTAVPPPTTVAAPPASDEPPATVEPTTVVEDTTTAPAATAHPIVRVAAPPTTTGALPATGSDTAPLATASAGAVLAGAFLVIVARRRATR